MSKGALASKETILTIVGHLVEMSKLDTLYRDIYIERARALLGTFFARGSYDGLAKLSQTGSTF